MLIGLIGQIGSGKGTAADFLVNNAKFYKESFAAPLKDAVASIFNWDRSMLEGDTPDSRRDREKIDPYWTRVIGEEITPRHILQVFGTEVIRDNFHRNMWVESFTKRYTDNPVDTVIADVRFPNEMEAIKKLGGKLYLIKRGEDPKWLTYARDTYYKGCNKASLDQIIQNIADLLNIATPHKSEWAWLLAESIIDEVIENDGTLKEFNVKINRLIT